MRIPLEATCFRFHRIPHVPTRSIKMVFPCSITGGAATVCIETSEVAFFPVDALQELDPNRLRAVDTKQAYRVFLEKRGLSPQEKDFLDAVSRQ